MNYRELREPQRSRERCECDELRAENEELRRLVLLADEFHTAYADWQNDPNAETDALANNAATVYCDAATEFDSARAKIVPCIPTP